MCVPTHHKDWREGGRGKEGEEVGWGRDSSVDIHSAEFLSFVNRHLKQQFVFV